MAEYTVAAGPQFEMLEAPLRLQAPDTDERLRRADLFLGLSSLVSYEQPLDEILATVSRHLVENTRAIAAAVNLVRPSDVATVALGYHNLPAGYLEAMEAARQSSIQGEWLRERAAEDKTWVLRQAPAYMLSRPEYAHMTESIRQLPFDTLIGTPFLNRPDLMGFVFLYYPEHVEVDDADIAFARELALHARPIMDNAWLFRETQRSAVELEALSKADQAMHRSILLEDVYQAMIDLAADLFDADRSLFLTFDAAGRFHAAAARGVPPEQLEGLQKIYESVERGSFARRGPELGIVEDMDSAPFTRPAIKNYTTAKSSVDVPVFVRGEFFGMFVIGYHQKRTFSEDDKRLFRTLAARAGLAFQNAVAFDTSQRRTHELEALYRADEALHRSLNLDNVHGAMADLALELLGADSSLVATFSEDDHLDVAVHRGFDDELLAVTRASYRRFDRDHFRARPSPTMALVEDARAEAKVPEAMRNLIHGSFAEVPVMLGGELWAIFAVGWENQRRFTEDDRHLFDAFAARASLAIQNALLFEQAQKSASMEERQRIARELHDSVSQALYGIGLGARTARRRLGETAPADVVEPVDYIVQLAESGLAETRALIFELVPESLEQQGLVLALQRQAAATQSRYRIEVSAYLAEEPDIPIRAKEALYRIAQESLHNMAKHAQATAATLSLTVQDGCVKLLVQDNGRGFDTNDEFPGHLGLRSMQERARRIGGDYALTSTPGVGTTVTVAVPLA